MAYVHPYVDQMSNKHTLAKEFRIIRALCLCYQEGPRLSLHLLNDGISYERPYSNFYFNKFARVFIGFLFSKGRETSPHSRTGRPWQSWIRAGNLNGSSLKDWKIHWQEFQHATKFCQRKVIMTKLSRCLNAT